ncbi:hypothetical protein BDV39DRAFT_143903 [Aspergillus sergii]|uniref:Uncharacterized protein n=1 Tax=Aspergillus sergii TaxID=1034303 RepID=A0A5N6WQX0_9EURO|nr:hypothetical protein BDV39DRAFT_143903 [Aspergillus sergii]
MISDICHSKHKSLNKHNTLCLPKSKDGSCLRPAFIIRPAGVLTVVITVLNADSPTLSDLFIRCDTHAKDGLDGLLFLCYFFANGRGSLYSMLIYLRHPPSSVLDGR